MTSFLSTFVNKIDSKGRVSVPAPFRACLAAETYQGVIAYSSLTDPAIDAFGRSVLEELNRRSLARNLDAGDFERTLLGSADSLMETVMALAFELPFDGQGRVILPPALLEAAGLNGHVTFVGRGSKFQIWSPSTFEQHQRDAVTKLKQKLNQDLSQ
jgi:MraZ protein